MAGIFEVQDRVVFIQLGSVFAKYFWKAKDLLRGICDFRKVQFAQRYSCF